MSQSALTMAEAENTNTNPPETAVITITEENNPDTKEQEANKPKEKIPLKSLKMRQLVLPLALVTFLLSLPFLFQAILLLYVQQYDCEGLLKSLPRLQIVIAIGLIFTFFVSNGVVYSRDRFPAPGLVLVKVPLVVMFIVGLSFGGSFKTETRRIPASPRWLKMNVNTNSNWNNIKSCIYDTRICRDLVARSYNLKSYEFTTRKLSPVESGCCKPPSIFIKLETKAEYQWHTVDYLTKDHPFAADAHLPSSVAFTVSPSPGRIARKTGMTTDCQITNYESAPAS